MKKTDWYKAAHRLAFENLSSWAEGTRHEDLWVMVSPHGPQDNKIPSFRLNLKTKNWVDLTTLDKKCGNDLLDLYRYILREKLEKTIIDKTVEGSEFKEAMRGAACLHICMKYGGVEEREKSIQMKGDWIKKYEDKKKGLIN